MRMLANMPPCRPGQYAESCWFRGRLQVRFVEYVPSSRFHKWLVTFEGGMTWWYDAPEYHWEIFDEPREET